MSLPSDSHQPTVCKLLIGSYVSDPLFNREDTCIVCNQNSLSLHNYGRCLDISNRYPYGNVVSKRRQDRTWRFYACPEDRDEEGSCIMKSPPHYIQGPTISTLITQFGIGLPVEDNPVTKKVIKRCTNGELVNKLTLDTQVRRTRLFKRCLYKLAFQLCGENYSHIKNVIIPVGIGRAGKADSVWFNEYLPLIHTFSLDVEKSGKRTILTATNKVLQLLKEEDFSTVAGNSVDNSHYEKLLYCLPTITQDQFDCKKNSDVNTDDCVDEEYEDMPNTQPYF